ncbi:Uncharacterised protein [Mycobacteroides abscessus subsp. bolletii]|nr:Uncharacterised protein [Mycobacteroides abscessus subsp. bolletii]SII61436.1 Uncharacterised protein [Mycobacteroides abscessus subsp. bolletii]SKS39639.1 Uncharacterised protein [Mycobacteroides abscessus subsp. bolletii]SKT48387.1 Uncharacterised protein [Mycobacteroides abscessus subsp. bolletii]SLD76535.1 Uncharacterised protein [Mycobacteroides abscessus subsp. bolletii]
MGGFKLNPNFERDMRRQLQTTFDEVYRSCAGQSVETVKSALARVGVTGDDSDTLAQAISSGTQVKIT